ncbi:hypothetical protein DOTSEDRAFT_74443 [Dothistroma septosporum NZE10]|uniref:Uncharacterized protein n=1 Tax=Dothistroma septosporum (strain NZE10 / CBS 128990) TaxID=675120 RepID=N1PE45_DOTSN|nr:hypothetical protein DOTSEDRAFT_74443 [Dothistroma septosporum NZE10]
MDLHTLDIAAFAKGHISQITAITGLVTFAITKRKLTPGGIVAGILVATIHMIHPWPAFFWLLILFFLFGTMVTKIGHARKASLTQSAAGGHGGEGARTSSQVFANSGFASILILTHAYLLRSTPFISSHISMTAGPYFPVLQKLLPIGIIAQYAAVAADTFSSELGILSLEQPFMVTAPWKNVPKGTNGGITVDGLKYGALGSALLTLVASVSLFLAEPKVQVGARSAVLLIVSGLAGSVIDSVLGALVQVTVTDKGSGKVVEGHGGQRVLVKGDGSRIQIGSDLLTNNGVNFVMAALASLLAMGVAWEMEIGI